MTARIISGKAVAKTVREEAAARLGQIREPLGRAPGLTVVLVGEDPASQVYVGRKEKASAAVGIRSETLRLPVDLSYGKVAGLSFEVREKLRRVRPETLGQAGRIPGITPAAITALLAHLRMREKRGTA